MKFLRIIVLTKTTLFIYLDGCRFDYASKKNCPFLFSCGVDGLMKRVKTVAGFTQKAAMLTGAYPEKSDHFTRYFLGPDTSPFRWLRSLGFFSLLRMAQSPAPLKVGIRKLTRLLTGVEYPDPAYIPLRLLPYFDIDLECKVSFEQAIADIPNVYEFCNEYGYKYLDLTNLRAFVGMKTFYPLFNNFFRSLESDKKYDLYILHIGDLDNLGHKYGPDSHYLKTTLLQIDGQIEKAYALLQKRSDDVNLIVVSDHGMRRVVGSINILKQLEKLRSKPIRDYLFFLDSVAARFWFKNEKSKKEITNMLSNLSHGHILSNDEKKMLHINFPHNKYGDLLFWADKGFVMTPSFFGKKEPKGMHGYLYDEKMDAIFIQHSQNNLVNDPLNEHEESMPLTRTFSAILDAMDPQKSKSFHDRHNLIYPVP